MFSKIENVLLFEVIKIFFVFVLSHARRDDRETSPQRHARPPTEATRPTTQLEIRRKQYGKTMETTRTKPAEQTRCSK